MKAPHQPASSQAPRLGLFQTDTQRDGSQIQQALDPVDDQPAVVTDTLRLGGEGGGTHDVGKSLKEATLALAAAEKKISELALEAAEARFDNEDAQGRHLDAKIEVHGDATQG